MAYPRCTGGRRGAPPEDCGGIWAFNEYQAGRGDAFDKRHYFDLTMPVKTALAGSV